MLDVFGDALTRQILLLASEAPVSAKEIAARLDVTPPTVYRRTDQLIDHDLLTVRHRVDDAGNHYRTFETGLRRVEIELADGGYTIDVQLRQSLGDAFGGFWSDLDQSTVRWRVDPSPGIGPTTNDTPPT